MRELEFRVYYQDTKEMIYNTCPCKNYSGIIMQSTNLKDKNGVKIFEGDIISHAPLGKEHYKDFREVKWQEIEDFEEAYIGFNIYPSYAKNMYVVGNIYQNPELLKG